VFDKTDKKIYFFTNKEIGDLLKNLKDKPSSQILFTYTPTSIYNNILGFIMPEKRWKTSKGFPARNPERDLACISLPLSTQRS
jgi:hypothetical protein